jgi:DNA topoisomerase-2
LNFIFVFFFREFNIEKGILEILRSDMYIGSIRRVEQELWIYDEDSNGMVLKKISFVPGLYKIFDEILVNAADNFQRDPNQTTIRVTIDVVNNQIIIKNDGNSIPVVIHEEQNKYVPEMVFGELLTGSNFDDEEEKVTGGRNGLGAKLTNIYSTEFIVETADGPNSKKKFKQIFTDNMINRTQPQIENAKAGESYVQISFKPDLKRFDMTELEQDMVALLKK